MALPIPKHLVWCSINNITKAELFAKAMVLGVYPCRCFFCCFLLLKSSPEVSVCYLLKLVVNCV